MCVAGVPRSIAPHYRTRDCHFTELGTAAAVRALLRNHPPATVPRGRSTRSRGRSLRGAATRHGVSGHATRKLAAMQQGAESVQLVRGTERTRRVQSVRRDGRDVSTLYGREGEGGRGGARLRRAGGRGRSGAGRGRSARAPPRAPPARRPRAQHGAARTGTHPPRRDTARPRRTGLQTSKRRRCAFCVS